MHEPLVDALERGDIVAAQDAIRMITDNAQNRLVRSIRAHRALRADGSTNGRSDPEAVSEGPFETTGPR